MVYGVGFYLSLLVLLALLRLSNGKPHYGPIIGNVYHVLYFRGCSSSSIPVPFMKVGFMIDTLQANNGYKIAVINKIFKLRGGLNQIRVLLIKKLAIFVLYNIHKIQVYGTL